MTSRRQYSVPGRILLIFILTAVVMAAIFLGVVRVGNDAERLAREIVGQNVVAVKALKEMEVSLVGQDEAVSRYLLTRDPRWLEKRGEDWSRFARGLSQVRDVVSTDAELQTLREIDDALPRYHVQVERVLEAATQGWDSDVVNRMRRENSLLPEIAPLDFTVEGGALCGVALSAYEQGTTAAEIAIRILAGESPADIPLAIPQATRAMVNAARAAGLGIEIPEETLSAIELIQ